MRGRTMGFAALRCVVALAGTAVLAACSTQLADVEKPATPNYGCIDDSPGCIAQRQATLRQLQGDRTRAWVRQPATAASYATGVRLFAFKTEKARLSCDELNVGRREADQGPGVLRGPSGQGLPPAIISRSVMFSGEVGKELAKEAQRRCRA